MRAFVAIDLARDIRVELAKLQERLRSSGSDVKWVEPSHIHITLKFLGDINQAQLEKSRESLSIIAKDFNLFYVSLSEVGAFPKLDYPRVIWAGVDKGREELILLNKRIEEIFEKSGFPKESRPYEPHITIGRVRSGKNKDRLKKIIMEHNFSLEAVMAVDKVTLYQSTLTTAGPIYTVLSEAEFRKKGIQCGYRI